MLRLPDVRRIELGWGAAQVGGYANTITFVIYAYSTGGAVLAAAYVASRTLAGMGVTLAATGAAGRGRPDLLLRRLTLLRALLLAVAAAVAAAGGSPFAVVALGTASSSLGGTYRPFQAALLPWLVRTPAELTSSNTVAAVFDNAAALAGPVVAGGLTAVAPAWVAMAAAGGFFGLATLSLRRLTVSHRSGGPGMGRSGAPGHVRVLAVRDAVGGLAALGRVAPPAGVAILGFAQTAVRGALAVLIAVLAVKTLALGSSAVGWLNAAIGAGGLAGGALAAVAVRGTRLGRSFIAGVLLWGLPLAVLALVAHPAIAYLALAVVGVGNAVEDVGVFTLVVRSVSPQVAGRALGALEFLAQAGLAAGSLAAPLLLHAVGVRDTLALLGGGLSVLGLAHARRFTRLDRAMPEPGEELDLLRRLDMFAPLPLAVTELLAAELKPHEYAAGTLVMREGDPGEEFHLITEGSAAVTVHGRPRPVLRRGECFGEIALLRHVPRTATIMADQPLRTLALDRETFLFAVTANGQSNAAADALASRRLATDSGPGAAAGREEARLG